MGQLDKARIYTSIKPHLPALKACAAEAFSPESPATIAVMLHITVGELGKVTESALTEPATGDALPAPWPPETFVQCVLDEVATCTFPVPKGGIIISKLRLRLTFASSGLDS